MPATDLDVAWRRKRNAIPGQTKLRSQGRVLISSCYFSSLLLLFFSSLLARLETPLNRSKRMVELTRQRGSFRLNWIKLSVATLIKLISPVSAWSSLVGNTLSLVTHRVKSFVIEFPSLLLGPSLPRCLHFVHLSVRLLRNQSNLLPSAYFRSELRKARREFRKPRLAPTTRE